MPQYRKLNTGILSSPDVDAMPDDFTRLAWTWLPLICTRDGTGLLHTTLIKSQLFPMRRDVTEEMIAMTFRYFEQAGLITVYEVAGRIYFYVRNFHKYQGVTTKESPSPYPPPPEPVKTNSRPTPELVQSNARVGLPLVNIASASESESESEFVLDTPFRKLLDAFCEATGITELMLTGPKAVTEINDKWIPSNVTPEEVKAAAKQLQDKQYSISGPWSLTNTINMLRSGKKSSANKPASEKYKLPDDYDDDEMMDDDAPEVDVKWQTFVEQHVKDRRWQNLLEYGGEVDGMTIIHVPETAMDEAMSRFSSTIDRFFMGKALLEGVPV